MNKMTLLWILWVLPMVASLSYAQENQPKGIGVKGEAVIDVAPDQIEIVYSVYAEAREVMEVKKSIDKRSTESVKNLVKAGIPEKAITSSQIRLERSYDYDENRNRRFTGFTGSRSITVLVKDLDKYGAVIQAIIAAGIDAIESVSPTLSEREAIQKRALAEATKNAKEKASIMAEALGVKVGHPVSIREAFVTPRHEFMMADTMAQKSRAAQAPSHEFKPGDIEVQAEVFVEFEIRR